MFSAEQRRYFAHVARQRRWDLSLILIGWLHLAAFLICYYLTTVLDYHEAPGYLAVWFTEMAAMWIIFRLCGGRRRRDLPARAVELFVRRVWITYFILAFNLASMNTLRQHAMLEFFPAFASLASFGFIMMGIAVHWRFFVAMLVMFAAGLLMAAFFWHGFLIFAIAWWIVLNGIGIAIFQSRRMSQSAPDKELVCAYDRPAGARCDQATR